MVMTVVVIVVSAMLAATMVQIALAQRKQFETERRRVQAEWYAQAGLDRAAAARARSADYQGETWQIVEQAAGRTRSAQVEISINRDDVQPRLTVVVEYPVGDVQRVRCRREQTIVRPRGATAVSALQPENRVP